MEFIKSFFNNFTIEQILIYLLVLNLLGFVSMYIDKQKAKKGAWRISESFLLTTAFLGGSIGSLIGMYTFHHKTKKGRFFIGIPIFLILQIALAVYVIAF